ncbi:MAG TPA: TIGR04282 family arsenosugar biosynthesis glycosyltransferase [Cyclobacteriaceae bacterium]
MKKLKNNLLIIFYRNPELGKVKTRLAATLGDANALAIYLKLVAHTRAITLNLSMDKMVCYSNYVDREDSWSNENYDKQLQQGKELGDRLSHAIKIGFNKGYKAVCVIGTDNLELTTKLIEEAFVKLKTHEAVIGPAKDGGYYLLGLRKFIPEPFENKKWSTSSVCQDTLNDFQRIGLSYDMLPVLTDVDTETDLPDEIRTKLNGHP